MVALDVTTLDKTVTCTLSSVGYEVGNIKWQFSDGGYYYPSTHTISHTFTTYGEKSVTVTFTEYIGSLPRKSISRTFTLKDPTTPGTLKDPTTPGTLKDPTRINGIDVFREKPIVIPATCTGDISITAMIEELPKPVQSEKSLSEGVVSSFINIINIELAGGQSAEFIIDKDVTKDTSYEFGSVSDVDVTNLEMIPAFYSNGTINCGYCISENDDEDGAFDVTWEMSMMFPSMPEWYEGNFATDSQILKNLISNNFSETNFPSSADYTRYNPTFKIAGWSELPPFVFQWYVDPSTTVAIKRACLPAPQFKFTLTNNHSTRVLLNNAEIKWNWNYNPVGTFMNMRTEGDRRKKSKCMYTLPKGADATRLTTLDYPVYAIVDGYKVGKSGDPPEIVKVYGQWNEYNSDGDYYFPTVVQLLPVAEMSGPDFPTCLYKSDGYPLKSRDFLRITDGGWMDDDGPIVIDAPTIARDEHYRIISVTVADDLTPDDQSATFVITTTPNTSIDDYITVGELTTHMSKIHYFNVTMDYASTVSIPRSSINPIFYETLWDTYDHAPVLESIADEALNYINFSINDYPQLVPIYNNQTLSFSDKLTHAMDGIRSGKIFYIDGKTPNIINVQNPTKHKYKVKFKVNYNIYKHCYVVTANDIPDFQ